MRRPTLTLFSALQLFILCSAQISQQGQFPAGIIYGTKAAYKIDAPKNWILDNKSGISQGLPCVLYVNGFTWENSPVIMYAKIAGTNFDNMDSFIAFAIKEFKREDSNFYYKELKKGNIDSTNYVIMDYRGGPYNSHERVVYIQMKKAVGYIVFSAQNRDDFIKYSDAIFEVVNSYKYKPEFIDHKVGN